MNVGWLLKGYREKLGLNQSVAAKEAGISTSMLSQIEREGVSPSIDTLLNLLRALDIDPPTFFSRLTPETRVKVREKENRMVTEKEGALYEHLIGSPDPTFPAEMFIFELNPGCSTALPGRGHEGVEMGYVLCGEAVLRIDSDEYTLRSGNSFSFKSPLPHQLTNTKEERFRAVWNALPPHTDYLE